MDADGERVIKLAETVVSKVNADGSNTMGMLKTAKHILVTLQLFNEVTSSKYGEQRLHFVVRGPDKEQVLVAKMDAIALKLSDCVKMCDKIHGHRRINVFISMFGKSVLTKHLERARDLVGELQLKSLVVAESSYSPLQIFQQFYFEDRINMYGTYIGRGGSADIHRGTWSDHGKHTEVAVKIFRRSYSKDEGKLFHNRLSRECRAWTKLDHECILKFIGIHLANKGNDGRLEPGIVTPFYKFGASHEYFAVKRDVSKRHQLGFLRKVADAIAYIHEMGIVHGDVKPSNILVKDDGNPAICDFGNSRIVDSQNDAESSRPAGTARYLPPEAADYVLNSKSVSDFKPLTFAADVWSLAMTALELMSGRVPYDSYPSNIAIFLNVLNGTLPAQGDYDGVPQGVWDILVRCWIYDADGRPTMSAVKQDLDVSGIEDDGESPSIPGFKLESDFCSPPSSSALQLSRSQ